MGILSDLFSGNFSGVYEDVVKSLQKLPPSVQNFISALESDEGQILQNLVSVAVKDVETAGFTTASFVAAGKDVLAQLVSQNISTFSIQNILGLINIAAAPLVAPAVIVPASTPPAAIGG